MKARRKNDQPDSRERLRRAFSYHEKALREAAAARDDHSKLAAASHAREAERLIPGIRDELAREASALGRQLQESLATQKQLHTDAASGAVRPRKANRLNRRFVERIERLRGQIDDLNRCLNAAGSEELGGFADMPLPAYVRAIRKTPPRLPAMPSPAGFVVWIALVALAVLGSLYYLDYFKTVSPVVMEVEQTQDGGRAVRIMCRNDSEKPILLYVPWLNQADSELDGAPGSKQYGVAVYIRERGSNDFRLFPVAVSAWTYQGRTIQASTPIQVAPHLYVNLVLDRTAALAGTDPQAVRLVLLDSAGRPVATHEVDLPH